MSGDINGGDHHILKEMEGSAFLGWGVVGHASVWRRAESHAKQGNLEMR